MKQIRQTQVVILAMVLVLLLVWAPFPYANNHIHAFAKEYSDEDEVLYRTAEENISKLLLWKTTKASVNDNQELFNDMAETGGTSPSDWYALALLRLYGGENAANYFECLASRCIEPEKTDVEQYRRFLVMALFQISQPPISATGEQDLGFCCPDEWIAPDTLEKKGIMSKIYRLLYLATVWDAENVPKKQEEEISEAIEDLLALELSSGGFALTGTNADIDITSMAVQALAPYASFSERARESLLRSYQLLCRRQQENGGFASFQTENAESCAQAIIAFCALYCSACVAENEGMDTSYHSFFSLDELRERISQTVTAMRRFACAEGGYGHAFTDENGLRENELASAEVLCAYTSILRAFAKEEAGFFYPQAKEIVHIVDQEPLTETEESMSAAATEEMSNGASVVETKDKDEWTSGQIRLILLGLFSFVMLMFLLAAITGRKKEGIKRKVAVLLCIGVAGICVIFFGKIQTKREHEEAMLAETIAPDEAVIVTFSIDFKDGTPLLFEMQPVTARKGESVYLLLKRVCEENHISLDTSVSLGSVYVRGIGGHYEQDEGALSGWIFLVNGKVVNTDCGSRKVQKGDEIRWVYTRDLGKDVQP